MIDIKTYFDRVQGYFYHDNNFEDSNLVWINLPVWLLSWTFHTECTRNLMTTGKNKKIEVTMQDERDK